VEARVVRSDQGRLLYLAPDAQDNLQLTQLSLSSSTPMTLTQAPYGIMDFGVSDDGRIVYSAWREDEGTELWAIQSDGQNARLLVPCENAACGRIAWAPAGNQFTYEKHGGAGGPATPALWLFDWDSQTAKPMAGEDQQARVNASWSPDGGWLSYFLPDEAVIRVVHMADGNSYDLPNDLGDPVAWDPAGRAVVSLEIKPDGNLMLARLMRLDLDTGDRKEIGAAGMADRQPVWSPTGEWLAVTRRDWTGAYPSKTQIWLMRGDGADARAVLADPDIQYLSPVWSPDGRFLLFQKYSSDQSFVQPEVWMLELETGQTTQVLPSAGQVVWLP
jgi:Tol biopolymer transport system component